MGKTQTTPELLKTTKGDINIIYNLTITNQASIILSFKAVEQNARFAQVAPESHAEIKSPLTIQILHNLKILWMK